jgi:hypothetical protein
MRISAVAPMVCTLMGLIASSGALAQQSSASTNPSDDHGASTASLGQRCKTAPYAATEAQLTAYLAAVLPHLGGDKPYNRTVAESFVQSVCRMKFGIDSRKPLHDYGITDQQIRNADSATLTRKLLEACNYYITLGSTDSYEMGEKVKRESRHDGQYAPIICSAGFCNGPHDPAYIFSSLLDCKQYLRQLHLPYDTSTSVKTHGYCAYHAPEWQAVQ